MKIQIQITTILFIFAISTAALKDSKAQVSGEHEITMKNNVKVVFPSKPEERVREGALPSYRLKLADSTANLACIAVDLTSSGIDAAGYAEYVKNNEFWENVKKGLTQQIKGSRILKDEIKEYQGTPCLYVEMERKENGKTDILYQMIFIKGIINYSLAFNSRNGKGDLKVRDSFFNSVKIN